eukprot:13553551-Alexandrium_andersonii.AAC.1
MSASLVGSEMCIRDRGGPIGGFRAGSEVVRGGVPWAFAIPPCPTCPGAVSYTHLTLPTICSV